MRTSTQAMNLVKQNLLHIVFPKYNIYAWFPNAMDLCMSCTQTYICSLSLQNHASIYATSNIRTDNTTAEVTVSIVHTIYLYLAGVGWTDALGVGAKPGALASLNSAPSSGDG